MWVSPNDPTGSYTDITQYSDGTALNPGDFTRSKYPSESEGWQPDVQNRCVACSVRVRLQAAQTAVQVVGSL